MDFTLNCLPATNLLDCARSNGGEWRRLTARGREEDEKKRVLGRKGEVVECRESEEKR